MGEWGGAERGGKVWEGGGKRGGEEEEGGGVYMAN